MSDTKDGGPSFGTRSEWITAAVFLVIASPFALWFVACDRPARPTVPQSAIQACMDRVRESANHPSTVKFSLAGQATDTTEVGAYRVRLGFTAQNSFGAELRMDSLCIFEPGSNTQIARFGAWEK